MAGLKRLQIGKLTLDTKLRGKAFVDKLMPVMNSEDAVDGEKPMRGMRHAKPSKK
jgi:hypothetical protein